MKKVILTLIVAATIVSASCSSDDTTATPNMNPSDIALTIIDNSPSLGYDFDWNDATDADGDTVTYDFYQGTEIIAKDLTVSTYKFVSADQTSISFPISFKVIAKDGKEGTSESNVISVQDPVVATWQIDQVFNNDVETPQSECDKMTTLEFKVDGTFSGNSFFTNSSDACESEAFSGNWSNKGSLKYEILAPGDTNGDEYTITVENDKLTLLSEAVDNTTPLTERIIYIKK